MTEDAQDETSGTGKGSALRIFAGLVLALVLGGAGFYAAYTGLIPSTNESTSSNDDQRSNPLGDIVFVGIDPMVISLGREAGNRHLRFRAQLEVPRGNKADVERLLPRVMDIFNSYLRAVELSELEKPSNLSRLRAHMLRRVQMVLGKDRVNDLLIMEFVLN